MNIQSLSIVVPTGKCWNHCEFCVSRMHSEDYGKSCLSRDKDRVYIPVGYLNRMKFVRECGCNTMMITGSAEPQQNMPFIMSLLEANAKLPMPFYNIELQTTGSGLEYRDLEDFAYGSRDGSGITTIAFSISSFDDERNWDIINVPQNKRTLKLKALIKESKDFGMNVRASINLTNEFEDFSAKDYFEWGNDLHVDQMTFRKIYADGNGDEAEWVKSHEFRKDKFEEICWYITKYGTPIARLPFGFIKYSVNGISTVIDDNCMSKDNIDEMKYAILRPNGKLYSRWDDTGSLIF